MVCICVFLALAVLAVFGQTARFRFVNWDDDRYVYDNARVTSGLSMQGVAWALTHATCNFYHPLTMISLMLDYQFHKLNAGGYHLTNVLFHAASTVLLFLILRRMTGALWRSAFVAAVFGIHPLRVESVAWVSERKDVLATFFFMLTLGAYARYARNPNSLGRYLTVAGFFGLGLLCKPTAVALPFVLLLLDYWPLNRFAAPMPACSTGTPIAQPGCFGIPRRLILEKIPLVALAAVACVAAYFAQGKAVVSIAKIPMAWRIGNVFISCVVYLRQMVWPTGLAIYYPYPEKSDLLWEAALCFVLLAGICGGVLALWRKHPWLLAGWFWYLGMLAPVIGIVAVNPSAHGDRNTYLPQIGLCVLLAWAAEDWSAGWKSWRPALGGLMVVFIGALMVCGRNQVLYWKDSETLWKRALACTFSNSAAHNNLGQALYQKGELEEAIRQYKQALEINPAYKDAQNNLGVALFAKGDLEEAIAQYRKALEINPDDAGSLSNLGLAFLKKGDLDEAITQYRKVLKINPNLAEARSNLGLALFRKGDQEQAIAQYREVLKIRPDDAGAYNNLGLALVKEGQLDEAIAQYRKALEIKPDYAEIHGNLGDALARKGNLEDGIAQFQKAVALQPDLAEARDNLGKALLRKGDFGGAMACLEKTTAPSPDPLARWNNLGNELLQKQDWDEAIVCYQQAIKINPRSADTFPYLGMAFFKKGEIKEAMGCWQQALEINSNQVYVLNNLAWLLATTPEASLRDGAKAVALAAQANQLSGGGNPLVLHTLAAAYAEAGSYGLAAVTARRGLELAVEQKNDALAATLQKEIKLYEADTPARDSTMRESEMARPGEAPQRGEPTVRDAPQ